MARFLPRCSFHTRTNGRFHAAAATWAAALVFLMCCARPPRAHGQLAYEGFDYAVGTPHTGWAGGTGFNGPWRREFQAEVGAGSLSDPTNTLLTMGNHADGAILPRQLAAVPGADFWVSYLMRRRGNSTFGWTGLRVEGAGSNYFFGEPGGGPGDGTLVISDGNDATAVSSGVPFESGRDYFLVAHFQLGEGNDLATLYVNPTPGTVAPSGGVTFGGIDFAPGRPTLAFTGVGEGAANISFDELRVGATYAEVAPVVPEPGALGALAMSLVVLARRRRRH